MECWADLPEELLCLILSNLFTTKDRRTFKLVCRSWNSAATASPYYPHQPCLTYFEKKKLSWKFHQYNDSFYAHLPEYTNAKIQCSNFGWLLMQRQNGSSFFYDPFNNNRIEVPSASNRSYYFHYTTMHFFHPPTSPHCFIVAVCDYRRVYHGGCLWIGILKHGSCEWENHGYLLEKPFWMSKCAPVLRNGLLYFLSLKGDVAVFDVNKHKSDSAWTVHTNCLRPRRLRDRIEGRFLLRIKDDDDDAIFAVFVMDGVGETSVYKLLERKMGWELVNDLGDKVLYVSHLSSFGVMAPVKSMGNAINFAQLDDGSPVFYSLEDQKYSSFDSGNYSSNSPYGHERLDCAAWIRPRGKTDMEPKQWI